jgi:GDP-mannose 6-dehydrogenase
MNVSVFGLGYVGCVTAACLAQQGHRVAGIDVSAEKVATLNAGHSPVMERGLERLIRDAVDDGRLWATQDVEAAVAHGEICLICVGTPSDAHGKLNLEYVERVSGEIGAALAGMAGYRVIALRSTVLPGVLASRLLPILARTSGRMPGEGFGMVINPEFLREGSAIEDFQNPPFTLIGEIDRLAGDRMAALYAGIEAPLIRVAPDVACMVKYASNAFHALKVTFANEMGRLCKALGIDSMAVMDIFCQDTRLNISARYLRPGFAFGGSCLPKDLRALVYLARHSDTDVPVLEAILPSNGLQVQLALDAVQRAGKKRVAIAGLSFKPNTDDLRESPMVLLAETLIGKGFAVRIYDPHVNLSRLVGGNRAYIEQMIPHIASLTCDSLAEAVASADVIIAAHGIGDELPGLVHDGQLLIDLARLSEDAVRHNEAVYEGLCW